MSSRQNHPSRCQHCNQRLRPFRSCKCVPPPMMGSEFQKTLPIVGVGGVSSSRVLESFRNNFRKVVSSTTGNRPVVSKLSTESSIPRLELPVHQLSGGKRAVLCGVTYRRGRHRYRLKGTVNDVRHIKHLLTTRFGFSEPNILVLTDAEEDANKGRSPTKEHILAALKWLVSGCVAGDSLVFFFSGHGVRQPERVLGDEADGFDETILPVDFKANGMIIDDDINAAIVQPLPNGVTLHAIVDSCHSGTILDLPYVYDYKLGKWNDNIPSSGTIKGTKGGLAISLSACSDEDVASDTSLMSGKSMTGAMTYSLVQAITNKKQGRLTYGELLWSIYEAIKAANSKSRCLRLPRSKLLQEPMLSSSEKFDVNTKVIEL